MTSAATAANGRARGARRRRGRGSRWSRRRRDDHEQSRKYTTSHRRIASLPGRTLLPASERYRAARRENERRTGMASLTWLGHAAFLLESDEGKRIYIDPFLTGNPKTPEDLKSPEQGRRHRRHARPRRPRRRHRRALAGLPGRADRLPGRAQDWLGAKGANVGHLPGLNKGGTQEIDGIHFTLVNAFHSSSSDDGRVPRRGVRDRDQARGRPRRLLRRRHLRLRRHGADRAALRARLRGAADRRPLHDGPARGRASRSTCSATRRCIPCHYGTFPLLTGTPEQLQVEAPNATILELEPGDTMLLD